MAYAIAKIPDHWFILATSAELGTTPKKCTLMGTPIALFRGANGRAAALLDRCPHRNVPLSGGRVREGQLECPYHGWRFDGAGACRSIPLRVVQDQAKAHRCESFAVREQQGFVWVYSTPDSEPVREPHRFALMDTPGYTTVSQAITMGGTLYSTVENALDVPHTMFLHRGLFRKDSRGIAIEARVHRGVDRVEVEYVGEPRPPGVMGRVLSPSGGTVTHFDRFLLPSIAQVEYRLGEENHVLADTAMTPVNDFETRLYGVVSLRTRLPSRFLAPLALPLARFVLWQDARMLAQQTKTVRHFHGERFASTELDVIGKHVWRLLRSAERGEGVKEADERVRLVV